MSLAGRTLSHYRVLEEISRGGMGIVYRATDTRLNRDVALKVLPTELTADRDRRERFTREARAASALEHPNIAVIHDVGEEDGVSFIAMELIRGDKLSTALHGGQLQSTSRLLDIAIEIAEGLARAHTQGIVHRDMKPSNVMLTEDGHAKVIDFGLAKLVGPISGDGNTITAGATDPAVVLGTVSYMAPEQARGATIDHRTDIFSFGVLLYEMLTRTLPFNGHSSIETMHAIMHSAPTPMRIDDAVPHTVIADLQRIVDKCLAKDPDSRYQGMKDLVVDLKAARRRLDVESSVAHTVSSNAAQRSTTAPTGRGAFARSPLLIVAATLAVIAGGYWIWSSKYRTPVAEATGTRPSVAVMYFENNTGNKDLDWLRTGLTDMLVTDLSQSPDIEVLGTDRLVQILGSLNKLDDRQVSFDTVQEIARRAGVKHVMLGSFVKSGETIRINLKLQEASTGKIVSAERVDATNEANLFPTMDDLTRRVKAKFALPDGTSLTRLITRPATSRDPLTLDRDLKDVTTSSIEAYREYAAGIELHQRSRYVDALPHFERAVQIDPNFALAYTKMAVAAGNIGRSNDREQYAKRALELVGHLTPRERYYIEGFYYSTKIESTTRAIEAYSKLLELYPDHSASRNNRGLLYLRTDQLDKSIADYSDLRARGFEFPGAVSNLASALIGSGKPDEAIDALREFANRYPEVETAHFNLAASYLSLNRFDEAVAALKVAEGLRPDYPPAIGTNALIATLRDDFAETRRQSARLIRMNTANARELGYLHTAYADLYQGRIRSAINQLERAVADQGPQGSDESALERTIIAEILRAQGRLGDAAAMAHKAVVDSRGRLSTMDALFQEAVAGSGPARAELQRVADTLPAGSDKALPLLVDAVIAIEDGRTGDAAALLQRYRALLPPGLLNGGSIVTFRQPRAVAAYWSGRERLASGDLDGAEREFMVNVNSPALRIYSPIEYVRGLYYLGQIAEQKGRRDKAREFYRRFLGYWRDGEIDRDKVADAIKKIGS